MKASLVDGVASVGSIAIGAGAGTAAGKLVGNSAVGSMFADTLAGNVAAQVTQKFGDAITYNITDGQAGTNLFEMLSKLNGGTLTQLSSDSIRDTGIAGFASLLGRVPKSNFKVKWTVPSAKNVLPVKLVEPTVQIDKSGLRGTLADSTGGTINRDMGGRLILSDGKYLDIPKAGSMDLETTLNWMESSGKRIDSLIDKNLSLQEQALKAVSLQRDFLNISTYAVNDGNAFGYLNTFHPVKSFDELKFDLQKQGYSGDALYEKIKLEAIENTNAHTIGCFVAGTLVRVQTDSTRAMDNWKPIEQIKVGDMVLSKPELGVGEPVYKRVINTFEFDDKEIWYVSLSGFDQEGSRSAYMGVTPNHPFYVTGYCDGFVGNDDNYTPYEKARWQRVDQLERGNVVVDAKGGHYMVTAARPLSAMKDSKLAWLQGDEDRIAWRNEPNGISYDLSKLNWSGRFQEVARGDSNYEMSLTGDPIHGFQPYLGKVYNFEVEDYHTYFVTMSDIWVHNTNCGEPVLKGSVASKKNGRDFNFDEHTKIYSSKNDFNDSLDGLEADAKRVVAVSGSHVARGMPKHQISNIVKFL